MIDMLKLFAAFALGSPSTRPSSSGSENSPSDREKCRQPWNMEHQRDEFSRRAAEAQRILQPAFSLRLCVSARDIMIFVISNNELRTRKSWPIKD